MREMQGAEDESEGSLHIVNDQGRIPIATPQIAYFHAPNLRCVKMRFNRASTVELNLYSFKYLDFFINFAFYINRALF